MGVSKFNGKIMKNLPSRSSEAVANCGAYCADGNQVMFDAIKMFSGMFCKKESNEVYRINPEKFATVEKVWEELSNVMKKSVEIRVRFLSQCKQLEEIYIALDGTPCYGKIQQQMKRRKSKEGYYLGNQLVFSTAMTCPGTKFSNMFAEIFSEKFTSFVMNGPKNQDGTYYLKLTKSLTDIPGEGEHKILDMVRRCKFSNYVKNTSGKSIMILSNDSDTVISLLHQNVSSVYFQTSVYFNKNIEERIVSLDDVRMAITDNYDMLKNIPLLFAFMGNDFLPEMMISQNIDTFHTNIINLCMDPNRRTILQLTKNLETSDGNITVINFDALTDLFGYIASVEAKIYTNPTPATQNCPEKPAILKHRVTDYNENELRSIKYKYYERVYTNFMLYAKGTNVEKVSENDLLKFEIEMSISYIKTFVWYFYYQSGYEVSKPLDNSFYEYCYPPLFSSLYMVLMDKKPEIMVNFSHDFNKDLIPKERTAEYFENLPIFTRLHLYMILQKDDYDTVYADNFYDRDVNYVKTFKPYEDKNQPLRNHSDKFPCFLNVYPFLDISEFLERYRNQSVEKVGKLVTLGGYSEPKSERFAESKYSIGGKKINFGELPDF